MTAAVARVTAVAARLPTPLVAWVATRALVVVAGVVASLTLGEPARGVDSEVPRAFALLGAWDTSWYLDVARDGYDPATALVGVVYTEYAFFPLLPGVMAAGEPLGVNPFFTALIISNLAFLGALWGMHALTRRRFGEAAAVRATWVLALFPPAFTASLAYTEGIALALAIGAALAASRDRYALAGIIAGVAALARPPGAVAAVLIVAMALAGPRSGRLRRAVLAAAPTVIALCAFLGWMQAARGGWSLPLDAQAAWGRETPLLGLFTQAPEEIVKTAARIGGGPFVAFGSWTTAIRDSAFGALYITLLVMLWRREGGLRSPWVVYALLVLALPLSSGKTDSLARLGLMAFPLMWPLADWIERRRLWREIVPVAVVLIVLLVAQLAIRSP